MENKIRYYRRLADMTQTELGNKVGASYSMICMYETGKTIPDEAMCKAIHKAISKELKKMEMEIEVSLDEMFPPVPGWRLR